MPLGVRTLVTCLCVGSVATAIAALWLSSAIMAIESLTTAREDQLASAAQQVSIEVLTYFQHGSNFASTMASMYNLSAVRNNVAPVSQLYDDYSNPLHILLRETPTISSVQGFTQRDPDRVAASPPADQVCDLDGFVITKTIVVLMNATTTGNPVGCNSTNVWTDCTPAAVTAFFTEGGDSATPGYASTTPFATIPCFVTANAASLWAGSNLPGNLSEWDTGIRTTQWATNIQTVVSPGMPQFLARSLHFSLAGPALAPNSGYGRITLQMTPSGLSELSVRTPQDVLVDAALVSDYDDVLMLFTNNRQLLAVSDQAIPVEGYYDGLLKLHQADNETAVGHRVANVASMIFGDHCSGNDPCDWTHVPRLITTADDIVAFANIDDKNAAYLNLLLVVAVAKSEILAPVRKLNTNIAIISCSILAVMCIVAFFAAGFLANPIAAFASRLLAASAMADLEDTAGTKSRVTELALMEESLRILVDQLLEYKSFLPASMFEASASDDDEGDKSSTASIHDATAKQSSVTHNTAAPSTRSNARSRMSVMHPPVKTTCNLARKNVTILCINVRGWSQYLADGIDGTRLVTEHNQYITRIAAGLRSKGNIDRFNGDRVLVSFGATNTCAGITSCKIGLEILKALVGETEFVRNGVVGGMARGPVTVGNSGGKTTKAFNLMGSTVNIAWKMADIAAQFCQKMAHELVINGVLFQDVQIEFAVLPVGLIGTQRKFSWMKKETFIPVYLVMRLLQAAQEDEWMYQMEQMQDATSSESTLQPMLTAIFDSRMDAGVFLEHRLALQAATENVSHPMIADLLTKTHSDFFTACMHVL
ncbi:putative MAP protein kinase [Diplonema papillatum]|nr:putative MAP protein kinase [Diplonema papillatum]